MATIPSQRTWTAGEIVTAAMLNSNVRDAVNFLLGRPHLEVRATSAQAMTNAAFTSVNFDTEDRDNDGTHSTVSNTSRLTCVTPGWYLPGGGVSFTNTSNGGQRIARFAINSTAVAASAGRNSSDASLIYVVAPRSRAVFLNAGDILEIQGFQDQTGGAALNTSVASSETQCGMSALWIAS